MASPAVQYFCASHKRQDFSVNIEHKMRALVFSTISSEAVLFQITDRDMVKKNIYIYIYSSSCKAANILVEF